MEGVNNQNKKDESDISHIYQYGVVELNSEKFDDLHLLGNDASWYKPETIKFWCKTINQESNKITKLSGIQITYLNIINDKQITTKVYKNKDNCEEKIKDNETEDIFIFRLGKKDFIDDFKLWLDDCVIRKLWLKTNMGKEMSIGEERGDVVERMLNHDIFILSFYGSYAPELNSIGFNYCTRKEMNEKIMKNIIGGFLLLKEKLKRDGQFKKTCLDKIQRKEMNEIEEAFVRSCLLPKTPFAVVVKFCCI